MSVISCLLAGADTRIETAREPSTSSRSVVPDVASPGNVLEQLEVGHVVDVGLLLDEVDQHGFVDLAAEGRDAAALNAHGERKRVIACFSAFV